MQRTDNDGSWTLPISLSTDRGASDLRQGIIDNLTTHLVLVEFDANALKDLALELW